MLTHDSKLYDPALKIALPREAFYIGALGNQVTQEQRRQRLLTAGISETNLVKLHAPIGIELGGQTRKKSPSSSWPKLSPCEMLAPVIHSLSE